jgi:hypothetical protein
VVVLGVTVDMAFRVTVTGYPGLVGLQARLTVDGDAVNNAASMVPAEPSNASSAKTAGGLPILNVENFI